MVRAYDLDASLWRHSGQSQLEGDPEEAPKYAGGITRPTWPETARRSQRIWLRRRICLLSYLTCCHYPVELGKQQKKDGWIYEASETEN